MSSPRKNKHAIAANTFKPTLLAHAIHITLAGTLFTLPAIGLLHSNSAYAQSAEAKSYAIPAGPLGIALTTFAAQADITLSFNADQTRGLQTSGLTGRYSAAAGLQQLLANSGLEAMHRGRGNYVLQAIPATKDATLALIQVQAPASTDSNERYILSSSNTATKFQLSARETPQSTSVVTRQQLDDQGVTSVKDALALSTGITVSQTDSEHSFVYSRGFKINNIQRDGLESPNIGISFYESGVDDLLSNTAIYDHIEIVRGASGLLNGTGSPGGVVNLVRKKPQKDFQASVTARAGSWSNYGAEADISTPFNADGSIRGRFVATATDKASFTDYYKRNQHQFYGIVEADITPNTVVSIGADYQKNNNKGISWAHIPGFKTNGERVYLPTSATTAVEWANSNTEQKNIFATMEHDFGNDWKLNLAAAHKKNSYYGDTANTSGRINAVTGLAGVGAGIFTVDYKQTTLDASVTGKYPLWGQQHDVMGGVNWSESTSDLTWIDSDYIDFVDLTNWQHNTPVPANYPWSGGADLTIKQQSAYLATRLHLGKALKVILGSRITSYEQKTYRVNGKLIPYAGAVYDLDDNHSLYASYTEIFTPQGELDKHENMLTPKLGRSYEAGIKGEYLDKKINASLAIFKTQEDNVATLDKTATRPNGQPAYVAENGIHSRGFEAEIAGALSPKLQVFGSYTHRISRKQDDTLYGTTMPKTLVKIGTTYRFSNALEGLKIGGNVTWQDRISETYLINNANRVLEQKSYAVVNLMGSYDVTKNLNLRLNVNNIFNRQYYASIGGFFGEVFHGEPRNINLTAKYQF